MKLLESKMNSPSQDALRRAEDARSDSQHSAGLVRFAPRSWFDRRAVALEVGRAYEAWHPFKREQYTGFDEEGGFASETWVPGWRYEPCGPEDVEEVWDGEGVQLRTIVSIHKPGKYPERVFYVRQWRDPDGRVFGNTALRVVVTPTFRHWLYGERWPDYSPAREAHVRWAAQSSEAQPQGPDCKEGATPPGLTNQKAVEP